MLLFVLWFWEQCCKIIIRTAWFFLLEKTSLKQMFPRRTFMAAKVGLWEKDLDNPRDCDPAFPWGAALCRGSSCVTLGAVPPLCRLLEKWENHFLEGKAKGCVLLGLNVEFPQFQRTVAASPPQYWWAMHLPVPAFPRVWGNSLTANEDN